MPSLIRRLAPSQPGQCGNGRTDLWCVLTEQIKLADLIQRRTLPLTLKSALKKPALTDYEQATHSQALEFPVGFANETP